MTQTFLLSPGVTLRCCQDHRFKQGRLSLQLVRPMCREEAALNALLPAVLLRGTADHPDIRSVTMHLDDLYGATVGVLVRRIGDLQTTGFLCGFTEDRFALPGDEILGPVVDFLEELLLKPRLEKGIFCPDTVESEKMNLLAELDSQLSDKAGYAASQLLKTMCRDDSFSIPRLGEKEQVAAITAENLHAHYEKILKTSPVELFYVGAAQPERVAALLRPLFDRLTREPMALPAQLPFRDAGPIHTRQAQQITQSRLNLGYTTAVTNRHEDFAAMQVMNTLLGAGMTSKLFQVIREKMSLCYSIGSGYYGSKGIVTVSAGIDRDKEDTVRAEVERQLEAIRREDFTREELTAAKEAVLSSLRGVLDSPGAMEGFFATGALSGLGLSLPEYRAAVEQVTAADVAGAARTLQYHSSFFLEGVAK